MDEESPASQIRSAKDLIVYQKAYAIAIRVFEVSKKFPSDERFGLTSQIRRSSKSVCTNLREAWAKRRYEAHFVMKLTDCAGENGETDTHLDFARDHHYITVDEHRALVGPNDEVGKMLTSMINNPEKFLLRL
jgi:four helix bundle protein